MFTFADFVKFNRLENEEFIFTTTGKIFEKNTIFNVKQQNTEKNFFFIFQQFLTSIKKCLFWGEEWTQGYNSIIF